MKKKKILLPFIFIFIVFLFLTACDKTNKLSTPVLSQNKNIVTWENIDNAEKYYVSVICSFEEGEKKYLVSTNSFDLDRYKKSGTFSIKVQAQGNEPQALREDGHRGHLRTSYSKPPQYPLPLHPMEQTQTFHRV